MSGPDGATTSCSQESRGCGLGDGLEIGGQRGVCQSLKSIRQVQGDFPTPENERDQALSLGQSLGPWAALLRGKLGSSGTF